MLMRAAHLLELQHDLVMTQKLLQDGGLVVPSCRDHGKGLLDKVWNLAQLLGYLEHLSHCCPSLPTPIGNSLPFAASADNQLQFCNLAERTHTERCHF